MKRRLRSMMLFASTTFMSIASGMPVLAAKNSNQSATAKSFDYENFDVKDIGSYDNGSMDGVKEAIVSQGGAFYNTLIIAGIVGTLLSIMVLGILMLIFKAGNYRDEHKSKALTIAIAVTAIFGGVSIVSLIIGIFNV